MASSYDLSHLDNHTLLGELTRLIGDSQQQEAQILAHIAEVDSRRLYAEAAYSSMFAYCVDALHLSEAAAYRRITAARAARRFPALLERVASGELHLCAIKLLAPHLSEGNCAELIDMATHASKRTLERRLAALYPRQPVKASIRKLPERRAKAAEPEGVTLAAQPAAAPAQQTAASVTAQPAPTPLLVPNANASDARRDQRATVDAWAADRYRVQFTMDGALRAKIERAKELLPMGDSDLVSLFGRALDALIGDLERKRFGVHEPVRPADEESEPVRPPDEESELVLGPAAESKEKRGQSGSRTRYIPRSVRRAVDARDGGQCTFARADGKRCAERRGLEFHHVRPFARGGENTVENLTLRCKTHNLYAAERDFGSRSVERFRCREPVATYAYGALAPHDAGAALPL